MDDEQLIRAFEAGRDPEGGFHHREHVRVAWWYLRSHPLREALTVFRARLRSFAEAQGAPQRYHDTITTAYVLLIHARLDARTRREPWTAFAAENADLLIWNPSILERYYRPETLWSDRARQTFVTPDLPVEAAWMAAAADLVS